MILMSPGMSVIAAGLVSGLCFIVINELRRGRAAKLDKDAKATQALNKNQCACCLKPFVVGRGVICGECGSRACRKGCSRWDTPENSWYCLFCHQRRLWLRKNEKWFETFGGSPANHDTEAHCFSVAKSQVFLGGADYAGVGPGAGLAAGGEEEAANSVERVRDFVEKIVESLVGDVDEIPIDRLYDHEAYDQLVENYREPLAGSLARLAVSLQLSVSNKPPSDTPTMAHAALRDLVERAVEEARKLPSLGNSDAGNSTETRDVSNQTYEDLLATAILNKVVEKYQTERVDDNSNTLHNGKSSQRPKYITSEIEVGLDEGVEEGSSSLEPLSQDEYSSDCSAPARKYSSIRQEPLSLTIEEHIEEVTTTYTSDEEEQENDEELRNGLDFRNAHRVPFPEFGMDIIDPSQESSEETQDEATSPTHVDLVTPIESWEENWLFQKKKMQAQSEPVSMLVPNPSEDFKPLIGDREADDTSDLSDCSAQSDEEIEEELLEAINNVGIQIPDSRELNESGDVVQVKTKMTNNATKVGKTGMDIEHDVLVENATLKSDGNWDEENKKSETVTTPSINSDVEDTLVFHFKDKNTSKVEQEANLHRDDSIRLIENEKSSSHLVSRDERTDDISMKIPEPIAKVETNNANVVKSTEVQGDARPQQLTRDLRLSVDETAVLKAVNDPQGLEQFAKPNSTDDQAGGDLDSTSKDEDPFVNLNDDLELEEVPRTPTSSPLRLETVVIETGIPIDLNSLDEKLVSIETKTGAKANLLNETFNSYVQRTEDLQSSLDSVPENSTEVKRNGVVKAEPIFADGANENSNIATTELRTSDQQNEDGAQQESEYTEHYATATQRHLDSLTRPGKTTGVKEVVAASDNHRDDNDDDDDIPPPIPSTPPPIAKLNQCREAAALAAIESQIVFEPETADRKRVEVDLFLATPPRPGTIAEREHKKWENAAPIENNPYSEENIQKRLWQRQYSRNISSDAIIGENSEASKMAGNSMQVVLGAGQPDVKRYGRDYYINDAKKSSGERMRRSAMLNAERRNSSLSQNSGSYDDDLEPQEGIRYQGAEPISRTVTEVNTTVASRQRNNVESSNYNVVTQGRQRVETTIRLRSAADEVDGDEGNVKSIESSISEVDDSWKGQNTDELLENVRRNSKNEVNAKLNNQEDAERTAILEARKSIVNENRKSINRIDLKAYGFENEIKTNGSSMTKITTTRVVNKLDLKSFGYDSELQRIQSTGRIDAKLNNEFDSKPTIMKMKGKSKCNLTQHKAEYEKSKSTHNLVEYVEASGDFHNTNDSSEILGKDKKLSDALHGFGGMTSAKSMPNVTKIEHFSQNITASRGYEDEEDFIISHLSRKREKFTEEERLRKEMIRASAKSQGLWKSETNILVSENTGGNNFSSSDEDEDATVQNESANILTMREGFNETTDSNIYISSNVDEDSPMPSVRRLAQTFVKEPEKKPIAATRVWNPHGNVKKERPTTPEIHIIETPRQMHSLTARSISREFREGLRQIPNKITAPPINYMISEQSTNVQNEPDVISSQVDRSTSDMDVIIPGKLKNNIKFWEQRQRQS